MANVYDFSSDKVDIYFMLIDSSGSMADDKGNVKEGLKSYKKSFESCPEANSIAVSISQFSNNFYPSDFKHISDLDIDYDPDGATALYYSIVKGAQYLNNYVKEVTKIIKCNPTNVTFILFSDGEPCKDPGNKENAIKTISSLNYAGVTTVFVAFGKAISSDFGKQMGFITTIDVEKGDELINFLGIKLSNSFKEQSKHYTALGANFFSHAVDNSNSEGYSKITAQVLEDDLWMDDI